MSTVLVVDDDRDVLALVKAQLRASGHKVVTAEHPSRVMDLLERDDFAPDLAVLDISLPEMTGFELAQNIHMREETCRLPVVFLSATLQTPGRFTGEDGVEAMYVMKSEIADALPAAVRDLLPDQLEG